MKRLLIAPLLVPLSLAASGPAQAQPLYLTEAQEMDLRIVEVRLRKRAVLTNDMIAYGDDGDILLPLSETVFALGFPIDVNVEAGTAEGWFLRETQNFSLNVAAGDVYIAGTALTFRPEEIRTDGGDLYVPLGLLSSWFELNSEWNGQTQTVNFEPDYLLIAEEQAQRLRRSPGSRSRGPRLDVQALDQIDAPYGWIGYPHGSADLSLNTQSGETSSTVGQANLALTGDLLKMTGELFVTGTTEGQKNARLTLGRTDASGNLFSPLLGDYGATRFRMGDISTVNHPILESGGSGLGFTIARSPLRQGGDFDTTRLEGDAFPGWQAELYRDGQLLGVLTIPESGRYLFDDVPLTFGVNRFRIELYGPSGERRTIDRPVDISNNFIRRGDVQYTVEFASLGRGIFTNRQDRAELDFEDDEEALPQTDSLGQLNDGYVGYGELAFGLTNAISGAAGVQLRGQEEGEDTQTGFVSLARRGGAAIMTGDLAVDDQGESAVRLGYSTEIRGVSISAIAENRSDRFGQTDTDTETGANVVSRANLRLDGRFLPPGLSREAGWSVSASGSERADGTTSLSAQGRLSGQIRGLSVSQNLDWRSDETLNSGRTETATSSLNVSGMLGLYRVRGGFDLNIRPDLEARSGQVEVSRRYGDWFGRVRYSQEFEDSTQTLGFGLTRDFNGIRLGADLRHTLDDSSTSALVSLSFDFDRHPNGNGLRIGRNARSDRGVARIRVYEDVDLDGQYTAHKDRIVENAAVIVEPRARLVANDRIVLLDDLSIDQLVGVKVDKDQLQDPYLVPASEGVSFTPRPAGAVRVDLPVVMSGEVELALKDEAGNPREGVIAELKPCGDDTTSFRERSAYDGYVFFQFIKPGCYNLSVPGETDQRVIVTPGDVIRPYRQVD